MSTTETAAASRRGGGGRGRAPSLRRSRQRSAGRAAARLPGVLVLLAPPDRAAGGRRLSRRGARHARLQHSPRARSAGASTRSSCWPPTSPAWWRGSASSSAYLAGHDWGAAVAYARGDVPAQVVKRLAILNVPHPLRMLEGFRTLKQLRKSWYMFFFQIPRLPEFLIGARGLLLRQALAAVGLQKGLHRRGPGALCRGVVAAGRADGRWSTTTARRCAARRAARSRACAPIECADARDLGHARPPSRQRAGRAAAQVGAERTHGADRGRYPLGAARCARAGERAADRALRRRLSAAPRASQSFARRCPLEGSSRCRAWSLSRRRLRCRLVGGWCRSLPSLPPPSSPPVFGSPVFGSSAARCAAGRTSLEPSCADFAGVGAASSCAAATVVLCAIAEPRVRA